jgi:hypothetical protein
MNKWSIILTFLGLMSVLITPASACFPALDGNQLEDLSDLMVTGEVIGNTSVQWTTNDGKLPSEYNSPYIYYYYIIEVNEVHKGKLPSDAENKIYVLHEGGIVGDIGMGVSTQTELKTGQKALFYLWNDGTTDFGSERYRDVYPPKIISNDDYPGIITDEKTEKDVGGIKSETEVNGLKSETEVGSIKSLPLFKIILSIFSNIQQFFI